MDSRDLMVRSWFPPSPRVPDQHFTRRVKLATSRGEQVTVMAKSNAPDDPTGGGESADRPVSKIPNLHLAGLLLSSPIAGRRGEEMPIRAEGHAPGRQTVSAQKLDVI